MSISNNQAKGLIVSPGQQVHNAKRKGKEVYEERQIKQRTLIELEVKDKDCSYEYNLSSQGQTMQQLPVEFDENSLQPILFGMDLMTRDDISFMDLMTSEEISAMYLMTRDDISFMNQAKGLIISPGQQVHNAKRTGKEVYEERQIKQRTLIELEVKDKDCSYEYNLSSQGQTMQQLPGGFDENSLQQILFGMDLMARDDISFMDLMTSEEISVMYLMTRDDISFMDLLTKSKIF